MSGTRTFSCCTQAIPLICPRLISIKTTSGLSVGKPCNADGPFVYVLTQRNPGEPLMNLAMDSRSSFSSSTIETEIMLFLSVSGLFHSREEQNEFVFRGPARIRSRKAHPHLPAVDSCCQGPPRRPRGHSSANQPLQNPCHRPAP